MQRVFIHFNDTTSTVLLPHGTSIVIPAGYAATCCGRPGNEFVLNTECDIYVRPLLIGGRRKKKLSGSGDYKTIARNVGAAAQRSLMSKKGEANVLAVGKAIGQAIGSKIGASKMGGDAGMLIAGKARTLLGQKLQRLIGRGDYTIAGDTTAVNALIKGRPSAQNSFGGDHAEMNVEYREYIGDLVTGTVTNDGTVSSNSNLFTTYYNVNPGDPAAFPWLSNIAANYEEYCVEGLIFEFVSTTSPYNSNSAMGEIIVTSQDNVSGPVLSTRQELFNTEMCTTSRLDRNIMYGIECKNKPYQWYFVSSNAGTTDTNLQNFVRVYLASCVAATFPSNSVLGEIWVTYRMRFRGPVVTASSSANMLFISGSTTLSSPDGPPSLVLTTPKTWARGSFSFNNVQGIPTINSPLGLQPIFDNAAGYTFAMDTAIDYDTSPSLLQVNCGAMAPGRVYAITVVMTAAYSNNGGEDFVPPGIGLPLVVVASPDMYPYGFNLDTSPGGASYSPLSYYVNPDLPTNNSVTFLNGETSRYFRSWIVNQKCGDTIPNAATGATNVISQTFLMQYNPTSTYRSGSAVMGSYTNASAAGGSTPLTSGTIFVGFDRLQSASANLVDLGVPITSGVAGSSYGQSSATVSIIEIGPFDIGRYSANTTPFNRGASVVNPFQRNSISVTSAMGAGGLL